MFQRPAEATPDFAFAAGHSACDIPLEFASNHIYLQLRVNDSAPLWFILDTGAGSSVIDAEQARAEGLALQGKLEGRGAGEGSIDVAFVAGATFHLPGIEVVDQTIAAIPLQALAPFDGRPVHGILGYDFISRFVVEIDYAGGLLHLHDPQHYTYTGPGERLAIFLEGNVPFVQAELVPPGRQAIQAQFLLDTGARVALVLNKPFIEAHRLVPEKTITAPFGMGVGGETKQYIGRVPQLQLGGITLSDIVAGFSQDVKGAGANPDRAGLIGGDVLRRFTAIFDYASGHMILEPNAHCTEPYEYDMSGLFLATQGAPHDAFRVHRVVADSPAAEAGLQEGDMLIALDGHPAQEFTLEQIRQSFKAPGRQVRLTVQREAEEQEVVLALRRLI
jgi:predicted aspartyl protease